MRKLLPLLLLLLGSLLVIVSAEDLFIKSKYAKVIKNPRYRQPVAKVKRGEKVQQIRKKRGWYKVSYKGKRGWIYGRKVTRSRPSVDPSLRTSGGSTNLLAGEQIAAGSALRGLSPLAQKFAQNNPVTAQERKYADYHQSYITITFESVDTQSRVSEQGIDKVVLQSEDIENFLQQGNLGAYHNAPDVE